MTPTKMATANTMAESSTPSWPRATNAERGAQETDHDVVHRLPGPRVDHVSQDLEGEEHHRPADGQKHGEQDDLEPGELVHDEELGVLAEQVEQRLCHRQAPERQHGREAPMRYGADMEASAHGRSLEAALEGSRRGLLPDRGGTGNRGFRRERDDDGRRPRPTTL